MTRPPRKPPYIFLDPDGSGGDILGVIIAAHTGIEFGSQCAGLLCEERRMQGYFVPISGSRTDPDDGRIDIALLHDVFHVGDRCLQGTEGFQITEYVGALRHAVAQIPFWYEDDQQNSQRVALELDVTRLAEATEAWVPVCTPLGRGVLVWPNCD